jgi:hypothetical protein
MHFTIGRGVAQGVASISHILATDQLIGYLSLDFTYLKKDLFFDGRKVSLKVSWNKS